MFGLHSRHELLRLCHHLSATSAQYQCFSITNKAACSLAYFTNAQTYTNPVGALQCPGIVVPPHPDASFAGTPVIQVTFTSTYDEATCARVFYAEINIIATGQGITLISFTTDFKFTFGDGSVFGSNQKRGGFARQTSTSYTAVLQIANSVQGNVDSQTESSLFYNDASANHNLMAPYVLITSISISGLKTTKPPATTGGSTNQISDGALAGIIIGSIVGGAAIIALIAVAIYFCSRGPSYPLPFRSPAAAYRP